MRNRIIALALLGSLVFVSAAWAHGGEVTSELNQIWHEQQLRHKEWADVRHKTGPAERKALRNYINNLPRLWNAGQDG